MTTVPCSPQFIQVSDLYNNYGGYHTPVSNVQIQHSQIHEKPRSNTSTDIGTYLALLRQCSRTKSLNDAKLLQKRIMDEGYGQHRLLMNTLIHVYGKCGALPLAQDAFLNLYDKNVYSWTMMLGACVECGCFNDAIKIFDQMPERGLVSWNIIIAACTKSGKVENTIRYYNEMRSIVTPNVTTYLNLIPVLNKKECFVHGVELHSHVIEFGLDYETAIGNALLNMYGKCGDLYNAELMFEKILQRDNFTWNTMISHYVQHGQGKKATQVFSKMLLEGVLPDYITYVGLIDACALIFDFPAGLEIHRSAVGDGYELNTVVSISLINMYGKCKCLESAETAFKKLPERDLVAWNAMIEAYAQLNRHIDALEVFKLMQIEGCIPDSITFVSLLSSCEFKEASVVGMQIHKHVLLMVLRGNHVLNNALVSMHGRCECLEEALKVFSQMQERNVMITACTQNGELEMALGMFESMKNSGVLPNQISILGVLEACAGKGELTKGKELHNYIHYAGLAFDNTVASALIRMYSKCGNLKDAWNVFDRTLTKDLILWNTMIGCYAQHGLGERALCVFEQMKSQGVKPDQSTFASVLSACNHTGLSSEGQLYFISMIQDYGLTPEIEHFNLLFDLLGRSGQITIVHDLIKDMPIEPTAASWLTLLSACKKHYLAELGTQITKEVLESDPKIAGAYVLCSNVFQYEE